MRILRFIICVLKQDHAWVRSSRKGYETCVRCRHRRRAKQMPHDNGFG